MTDKVRVKYDVVAKRTIGKFVFYAGNWQDTGERYKKTKEYDHLDHGEQIEIAEQNEDSDELIVLFDDQCEPTFYKRID